jgi:NHL repeat-containing protein
LPALSNGTVSPTTFLFGTTTTLAYNFFAFADASNRVWTTNCLGLATSGPVAFTPTQTGDTPPSVSIVGSNTGLSGCQTGIYVDGSGTIYVGDDTSTAQFPGGQVAVFAPGSSGNVTPIRRIAGVNPNFHAPTGVWLDAAGNIYVADSTIGFIGIPPDIQVFATGSTGNVASIRTIIGSNTGLSGPEGVVVDSVGQLYVANAGNNSIAIFAPNASGNVAPIRTISGPTTLLDAPSGLALDAAGYLYVGSANGSRAAPVLVFAPGASGNAAPVQTITINAPRSNYAAPAGIAVR